MQGANVAETARDVAKLVTEGKQIRKRTA